MGKGKAIAGFVMSLLGVIFGLLNGIFSILGLPIAIIGLCLAVSGGKELKSNEQPSGIATAGLVLGIIAVVFTTIAFFTCGICVLCAGAAGRGLMQLGSAF